MAAQNPVGSVGIVALIKDFFNWIKNYTYSKQEINDTVNHFASDQEIASLFDNITPADVIDTTRSVVLHSQDGTAYKLIVSNDGTLGTVPYNE